MPKLLIIQATGYQMRDVRVPYKLRRRKLVGAVLPHLAALAPKEWDVRLLDDATEPVDYDAEADVVALTVRTVTSFRAYEIARGFRDRNVPVLMGGPHATFHAEEMAEHADAVCIGEAEGVFPRMLEDVAAGRLQRFYRRDSPASLDDLPAPRWDLLDRSKYVWYRPYVIQYSRGCPFVCDFCAERRLNGDFGYRMRPVEQVVEDIRRCGSRHIFFAASQFAGDKAHAMALMEALIPLKVRWSTLLSAHYCLDEKFMDLAKASGMLHVNMGVESIDRKALKSMHKGFNPVQQYQEVLRNLKTRGISYSLNFVFGSDEEDEDVFESTLRFLVEQKAETAYFNLLTPLKGSPLHARFKEDGRILDEENMDRWPGLWCHFRPLRHTPEELMRRVIKIRRDFYSLRSAARRLPIPYRESHFAAWNLHFLQSKVANNMGRMRDFSEF
jgi:radical SAM superfamily enzyme YgiQ (UPF0313 family)